MVQVIKKGLETSVQDYPGRIGTLNQGFPSSGPMDSWSFRLANILVENESGAAALECQFMGPTLKFDSDRIIAITGANMHPKIDGKLVPLWESLAVKKDQILEAKKVRIEDKKKVKKTLKKIEAKEKKVTDNIEKRDVKKKSLTTKKK